MRNRILFFFILTLGYCLIICSCHRLGDDKVERIDFVYSFVVIEKGTSSQLEYSIIPSGINVAGIVWESSDERIAVVNNGVVQALSEGEVLITASYDTLVSNCYLRVIDHYHMAYSVLDNYPGNTLPHFLSAIESGYNTLKADMRITKDREIILCHDKGYTFNDEGRITRFDSSNYISIDSLTKDQVLSFEFADNTNDIHPCTLDVFLALCKDNHIVPFLTLRHDDLEDVTAEEMYRLLKKYELEKIAIINLYSYRKSQADYLHMLDQRLIICDTETGAVIVGKELIDRMKRANVSIICFRYDPTIESSLSSDIVQYAGSQGMKIWGWNIRTQEQYDRCRQLGLTGVTFFSNILANLVL